MISIEQVGSLTHVDASEWDQLAGRSVVATPRMLLRGNRLLPSRLERVSRTGAAGTLRASLLEK